MKNSWIENPNGENMLWCPFYIWKFFFRKKPKSQFLVEFQSFNTISVNDILEGLAVANPPQTQNPLFFSWRDWRL
jgi:hypothetical protein